MTTLLVTHDQEEAMEVADRLVIINEGRLEQIGAPADMYDHPANEFVLKFLGPATVSTAAGSGPMTWSYTADARSRAAVRATVERITHLGFEVRVDLALADGAAVWAQLSRGNAAELDLSPGDQVRVALAESAGPTGQAGAEPSGDEALARPDRAPLPAPVRS